MKSKLARYSADFVFCIAILALGYFVSEESHRGSLGAIQAGPIQVIAGHDSVIAGPRYAVRMGGQITLQPPGMRRTKARAVDLITLAQGGIAEIISMPRTSSATSKDAETAARAMLPNGVLHHAPKNTGIALYLVDRQKGESLQFVVGPQYYVGMKLPVYLEPTVLVAQFVAF